MPTKRTPPQSRSRPRGESSSTEGEKTGGATPATLTLMGTEDRQKSPETVPELPETVVNRWRAPDAPVKPLRMSGRATAPEEAVESVWTQSPSQFLDLLKIHGTQLSIKLKGRENFPEWERAVLRRARDLRAMPVLDGADEREVGAQTWDMMDLALVELMINSVGPSLRADILSKTAHKVIKTLRGRFAKGETAFYTIIGIRLAQMQQSHNQTVQEYISAFNNLKHNMRLQEVNWGQPRPAS